MAKRRKPSKEDDELVEDVAQPMSCTTLDHIFPSTEPDTRCYCGKRQWRPLIQLDDYLKPGMMVRTYRGGPIYLVEMVNESRARCRLIKVQAAINRRTEDKVDAGPKVMPMPGSEEWDAAVEAMMASAPNEEDEQRGQIINVSPRSVAERVTPQQLAEEQQEAQFNRRSEMGAVAGLPVGKSKAQKLAHKPNGAARPLTGAAAKAKASAKPKAAKTVRECGCGCKGETTSYFVPGHDARFKGWIKKVGDGRMSLDELKKAMGQKQFGKYAFTKKGAGFVTKTTYQEAAEA